MGKFAENLKRLRISRNLSQNKLSKMSGIPRATLFRLESIEDSNPTLNIIYKLCLALKVTPNDLIMVRSIEEWKH